MTRRPAAILLVACAVAFAVASCGGSTATPAPVPAPAGQEVTIVAANITFEPAAIRAAPGAPLHIVFENDDQGVPHDLGLYAGPGFATELAKTEVVIGPATLALDVPGLVPGEYQFRCDVHPTMTTKLQVGG